MQPVSQNNFLHKCNQLNLKNFALSTQLETFSVADMLNRSFFQEELQLNHVKHNQLPPQVPCETLTHDDQIEHRPVHFLIEHETVLPSLRDDCHLGLADFRQDQFPIRDDIEAEKTSY